MNQIQVPNTGGGRPASSVLSRGQRLGDFTIDGVYGRGAFGVIYLAHDADGGAVAVKALDAGTTPDDAAAFHREAEILGLLEHPNIVALRHFEPAGDPPFMALEQLGGPSLADALAAGNDLPDVRALLMALLDGLDHVHGAGYLHRDVKPGNVILASAGRPVLVDFGAALPIGGKPSAGTSRATPCYGALEQFVEDGTEGPWTDLYGLAAIAYRLVTGAPPPPALDRAEGADLAPAVEAGAGRLPKPVLTAIDWALVLAVHRRPQSVEDWRTALIDAWSAEDEAPVPAESPSPSPAPTSARVVDDYPPTEEITRVTPPKRRRARKVPLDLPIAPGPARPRPAVAPARRSSSGFGWVLVSVALLAGIAAAGYFVGWPYYLRNVKTEWLVDAAGGGDVRTISEALDAAAAGAVITVRPGTYAESLAIVRPVTLTGLEPGADGRPSVIVTPESGSCLTADAKPAAVSGFAFQQSAGAGTDGVACIDLRTDLRFRDNHVDADGGPALRVGAGANPTVSGNRLSATAAPAVMIGFGARGQFRDNRIASAERPGIVVNRAAPVIEGNTLEGTGLAGIVYDNSGAGRMADNTIRQAGASGIEIRGLSNPQIVGNRIEAARQAGVFVFDGGLGRIDGNTITGNAFSGVVVGAGAAPTLIGNTISENVEHGVLVLSGAGAVLQSNAIERNGGYGIALEKEVAVELDANLMSGNREPQTRRDGIVQPFPEDPDAEGDPEAALGAGSPDDLRPTITPSVEGGPE